MHVKNHVFWFCCCLVIVCLFSHSIILDSSWLIKVCVSTLLCSLLNELMVLDKVVSSAYKIKSNLLVDSEKSFIILRFPCIVSYFLTNFQIVSELTLPIRNILDYVIKSYDQWYRMPLINQEIYQLEFHLNPFYLWFCQSLQALHIQWNV